MKKKVWFKKMANRLISMAFSISILIFIGCEEKNYFEPKPDPDPPTEVEDDPSTLDFSTTQKVIFDFNFDIPAGVVSTFEVYAENPFEQNSEGGWDMRLDVLSIASGINVTGTTEIMRTLPAYITDLYVYSPSLFVPTLVHAKINNGRAVFEELGLNMPINEEEQEADTRSIKTGKFDHYLTGKKMTSVKQDKNTFFRPLEEYITKEDFPAAVRNAIAMAFPEGERVDPKYYTDAAIHIEQDGGSGEGVDLWVSVVSADGDFNNSLAYFCYDGPKEDLARMTQVERDELYVVCAFQFAKSSPTVSGALRAGEYVKLKYYDKVSKALKDKFPVGTTVGWVLSSNGFTGTVSNSYTRTRATKYPWYYSTPDWNSEKKDNNHTIIFTVEEGDKEYVCFGFEDLNNDAATVPPDCNDVIFHVKVSPVNAITPPPTIPGEGEIQETETKNGYLAFEDNWPRKGDYDLNDVVAKYESSITYVYKVDNSISYTEPYIRSIKDKITMVHAGANYSNAFAYKVDIDPKRLKSITIDGNPYSVVPDENGFLVELCPNVNAVIVPYEYGTTPKVYNVEMEFIESIDSYMTQYEFNTNELCAPYNPYISPKSGVEVHLPMYPPTSKATKSLFGTEDDRSGNGLWYVSGKNNNYPFAIHLSGVNNFTIPLEEECIDKTFPKYNSWVESGKTKDKDWYLHPVGN